MSSGETPARATTRARAGTTAPLRARAPYDWPALRDYLATRAIPGVEAVTRDGRYRRTVRLGGRSGHVAVGPGERGGALRFEVSPALAPALKPLTVRLRRLLDLDADPLAIAAHLRHDRALAPLVDRRPGLRLPGAVDGFELAVRAVLGQQVTVRGASTLAGRLIRLLAEPAPGPADGAPDEGTPAHLPLSADRVAEARPAALARIGIPRARAACLSALSRAVAAGELPELIEGATDDPATLVERLQALPGIGPWTATYVVMRACHWTDAFPASDLGLRKAMGGLAPARLLAVAERWRPWRAYAAQHLWASLAEDGAA